MTDVSKEATNFKTVHLFGEALSTSLPAAFIDSSDIRQVPNHQEVFLDPDSLTSIIFEINEHVSRNEDGKSLDDHQALLYHFHDIVSYTYEETHVRSFKSVAIPNLPDTPACRLMAMHKPSSTVYQQFESHVYTIIILVLVRLAKQSADVLISINVPYEPEPITTKDGEFNEVKLESLMNAGCLYEDQIIESFRIHDWGLFG